MAENGSTIEDTIRTYLASRGGSVDAPEGRGLTDEMARAIGVDPPLALSPILRQMESNGVIRRQVQGLLTYRIELVTPTGPATPPSDIPAAAENGAQLGSDTIPPVSAGEAPADATPARPRRPRSRRPGMAAPPTAEMPAAAAEGQAPLPTTDQLPAAAPDQTVRVRKAAGRRVPRAKRDVPPLPGDEAPAGAAAAAAETATVTPLSAPPTPGAVTPAEAEATPAVPPSVPAADTTGTVSPAPAAESVGTVSPAPAAEPAADAAPGIAAAVPPTPGLATTPGAQTDATAAPAASAATAPPDATTAAPTAAAATAPTDAAAAAPTEAAAAAPADVVAAGPTQAPAFDTTVVPPPPSAPAEAPFVNPWGTPVLSAPPVREQEAPRGSAATTTTKTRRNRTAALRSRLEMPVQDIKSEPNQTTIIAVAVAGIGLVLIAIIAVIVAHATTHHAATGTFSQSTDACRVVTAEDASTLFGVDAGNPHFVLGTCVYDDGTNELIVAVFRQQARAMYETSRSSDARDIANVGDSAYYQDGRLRILKGTNLLELTVTPIPPNWPSPKMLTLANTALARL